MHRIQFGWYRGQEQGISEFAVNIMPRLLGVEVKLITERDGTTFAEISSSDQQTIDRAYGALIAVDNLIALTASEDVLADIRHDNPEQANGIGKLLALLRDNLKLNHADLPEYAS